MTINLKRLLKEWITEEQLIGFAREACDLNDSMFANQDTREYIYKAAFFHGFRRSEELHSELTETLAVALIEAVKVLKELEHVEIHYGLRGGLATHPQTTLWEAKIDVSEVLTKLKLLGIEVDEE